MEIKPKQIKWDQIPEGWMVQPKYDGECNKLIIKDGQARLERFGENGKKGKDKTEFYPEIIDYVNDGLDDGSKNGKKWDNMVLVGEVCVLLNEFVASFPHIQLRMNTLSKVKQKLAMKDRRVSFMAFDIEEYKGENLDKKTYGERYKILKKLRLDCIDVPAVVDAVENLDNMMGYQQWKNDHPNGTLKDFVKEYEMEGLVIKNPNSPTEQVKLKNWDEDDFKVIGTETTEAGEARGWLISKLRLKDVKGTHVKKGQEFDCKYINYPQTEKAKEEVIGKTAIIKYMKMRGRDREYLAPRHPSLVEILEFEK